ncbi:SDR family NAD(P)-dependent oxidoreductase [Streptomyces yunnanensis]|uniref:NAD(P)-dependent dehydrogenase, short-chain alcohol dehydrogenase family n=1 Tax=Streptomyces yunnanensis TaxID=156453 RepID=A0A9X8QVP8_9ACTN|nr:SDR family NAD(P)-dependent oxidoreductase [Streptomyces yunnanensis]SHM48938.1 NAD(P)-dependent dehydrogenase, short-chain alcohol dehydrogenase family [Streptomyces yunnanensis]
MTIADIAMVTGANQGIGREVARQLAAAGMVVYLGARDVERGRAAARELSTAGDVRFVPLDVADQSQVDAAARTIEAEWGRLDVLVNNAGIGGTRPAVEETTADDFTEVMDVNLLGAVRTTHTLLPLLHKARRPRIVNVTSGRGSFTISDDPERMESRLQGLVYPVSKAALNMLTYQYARALPGFRINAVDPGFTATALNNHTGISTPMQSAATVAHIALAIDGPSGRLFDSTGQVGW